MSSSQITLLGAIAGVTIFLGLPVGRLSNPLPRLKAALNGVAVGVLLFLVWDILPHAWAPVDTALAGSHWRDAASSGVVLALGLAVGMAGLVHFDKAMGRRRSRAGTHNPERPAGWRSSGRLRTARTRPSVGC